MAKSGTSAPALNELRTSAAFTERLLVETTESDAAEAAMDALIEKREALLIDGTDAEITALDNRIGSERLRMERAEKRIKKLRDDLHLIQQEERAAADAAETAALELEKAEFEGKLSEARRAAAFLASFTHKERDLYERISKHNRKPGVKQIERPLRKLRYSAAPTRIAGIVKEIRTRAKDLRNNLRLGGPDAYETYEYEGLEELPAFSAEMDFDPEPLFRTVEIPRIFRDDIFYRVPFDQKV